MVKYEKVYIVVYLRVDEEGKSKPVCIEWVDGTRFNISKIIDERTAPPLYTGGALTRKYRVLIRGRERIIYFDMINKKWFVEKLIG